MTFSWYLVLASIALSAFVHGQLIGPVGPTTPLSRKTKVCNVLNYGAKADNVTNVAPAIRDAFHKCVLLRPGSRLVVPKGNFLTTENIILVNGTNWAFQLDGLITAYACKLSTPWILADSLNRSYAGNFSVPRETFLQGSSDVQLLNDTINGEGDGQFLENVVAIVNRKCAISLHIQLAKRASSCRLRILF